MGRVYDTSVKEEDIVFTLRRVVYVSAVSHTRVCLTSNPSPDLKAEDWEPDIPILQDSAQILPIHEHVDDQVSTPKYEDPSIMLYFENQTQNSRHASEPIPTAKPATSIARRYASSGAPSSSTLMKRPRSSSGGRIKLTNLAPDTIAEDIYKSFNTCGIPRDASVAHY